MKDATAAEKDKLREAERAWIKYRDANCAYHAAGEGTIARINAAACMRDMTKARAEQLSGGGAGRTSRAKRTAISVRPLNANPRAAPFRFF